MKQALTIIVLLTLTGCASSGRTLTVSDGQRWWSDEVAPASKGMGVTDAERAWSNYKPMKRAANSLSFTRAARNFSQATEDARRGLTIADANAAITHDDDYQRLLNRYSIGEASNALDRAQGR